MNRSLSVSFKLLLLALFFSGPASVPRLWAQGIEEYSSGMKVCLNEDGSKYFRFITWHQFWLQVNDNNSGSLKYGEPLGTSVDFGLRRSRLLLYTQLNDRFLILTHFGFNNQNAFSGGYLGTDAKKPQLYMHDAWTEYKVWDEYLSLGFGLHYWNGISRLSSASTLNFLNLDAPYSIGPPKKP